MTDTTTDTEAIKRKIAWLLEQAQRARQRRQTVTILPSDVEVIADMLDALLEQVAGDG